jgi:predicted N-acetyltransferase YhbS
MVKPSWQRKGIGTRLMRMAIDLLKNDGVYAISGLLDFYERFDFAIMMAGQLETRYEA